MPMFCYQCQEAAGNEACNASRGVCGKTEEVSNLQDLLIYTLKGTAAILMAAENAGVFEDIDREYGSFFCDALFTTLTNTNFAAPRIEELINQSLELRDTARTDFSRAYRERYGKDYDGDFPDAATFKPGEATRHDLQPEEVGVLRTGDEDLRSLRELTVYGIKGVAAYAHHARILGKEDGAIYTSIYRGLAATVDSSLGIEDLVDIVLETGHTAVKTLALLDEANTAAYGSPEPVEVAIGTGNRPGILISGHDLKDLEELLEQTAGTGIDVYTHGEMLPAHAYPAFSDHEHLKGNYGGSWWKQREEFEAFHGPILMTTNCITSPRDSYRNRLYTTGTAGYEGVRHIPERRGDGGKDFSPLIEQARECQPPEELEQGTIPSGFAHNALLSVADKVVEAVEQGAIKRFVVMAGCDGRHRERNYFTQVAENLPVDAVILTAGCAKYRYNKLDLGNIGGIPRVLDAGQCNDSYSLVVVAQKLVEAFGVEDVNQLPISFDIAWYEQKAVAVLLALLALGVKGIRLGPTLPAFISPEILSFLVEQFDIKPTGDVEEDVEAIMAGR